MNTALFTHPICLQHDTGDGHPECAERLSAVLAALEAEEFHLLDRQTAPLAEVDQIARVHDRRYVMQALAAVPKAGHIGLDADTVISPASGEAALRAAGALCAAVDYVMSGHVRNAFCAVRPPGHHAMPSHAMGFCVFNNVAIGALHARHHHGLKRVAVIDFDVHHGNGTEAMFRHDPGLMYCSTHQMPHYPGTGSPRERGDHGNIINAPLPPMAGSPEFRDAIGRLVLPALNNFKPEMIFISAGFDAHTRDPLASLHLTEDDYVWVTRKLLELAGEVCGGRVVSTLEGGYNLTALARCSAVHVREMMVG